MSTHTTTDRTLPFVLGEPRSFAGLTVFPLFASEPAGVEYIGLDEAANCGLAVTEVDEAGSVPSLRLVNPLEQCVLLYEGEELVGAKQNRILERTILTEAGTKLNIPVACVEAGRWSYRSRRLAPAPRAAYPELRRHKHVGLGALNQSEVWNNVAAKSARLRASSPTQAQEAMYLDRGKTLDEYAQALPRVDSQSGALIAIAGEVVCLDYVSRSDVFAGLYLKLLRGYALDALERPLERRVAKATVDRFLAVIARAKSAEQPAVGLGRELRFAGGCELAVDAEAVALTAFPS
jgi:ARG and Rhodanese-Phosphatase-superfamily-associated Protein domain